MRVDHAASPLATNITPGYAQGHAAVTAGQLPDEEVAGDVNRDVVEKAVDKLNKTIEVFSHRFKFSVHEATKRIMVQVIDTATEEVITEIPPEKILDLVAALQEMVGMLVDERV